MDDGAGPWPEPLPGPETFPRAGCPRPFPRGWTRPLPGDPSGPREPAGTLSMRLPQPDLPRTAITKLNPVAHLNWLPPTLDAGRRGPRRPRPDLLPFPRRAHSRLARNDSSILGYSTSRRRHSGPVDAPCGAVARGAGR